MKIYGVKRKSESHLEEEENKTHRPVTISNSVQEHPSDSALVQMSPRAVDRLTLESITRLEMAARSQTMNSYNHHCVASVPLDSTERAAEFPALQPSGM